MYKGYQVVAVTPAGRRRYLEMLCRHMLENTQIVDRHDLWVNTRDQNDISYMRHLSETCQFFKLVMPDQAVAARPAESIYQFFRHCVDEKTVYIRLDDDICYICPDAIKKLVDYRITHPEPFLVYPIIICNGMEWVLDCFRPVAKWDGSGWPWDNTNASLEHIRRHMEFLSEPCSDRYRCDPYVVPYSMNISVNCICWLGSDFKKFGGIVPPWPTNEEKWLSNHKPAELKRPNHITGDGVVVHFSYTHGRTMEIIEKHTNLYQRYFDLAKQIHPEMNYAMPKKQIVLL